MDDDILSQPEMGEDLLTADGFDEAIIGTTYRDSVTLVVYSISKCIEIIKKQNEWDDVTAEEWFNFNVSGAYVGKKTPIYVEDRGD